MNSKPFTYDSLKTVILYMDPNTRILLSSRAPSIRNAEKAVPLRIESLSIKHHRVSVNNIGYECGIYQVDCKNKQPYRVSGLSRLNWKRTCNVDEFGTRDYISAAGGMLPANNGHFENNLFGSYYREIIPTNEGRFQKLEEALEIEKQRLNQLMNYRPNENPVNNNIEAKICSKFRVIHYDPPRLYNRKDLELLKNEKMVKAAIRYVKDRIRQMKQELVLFQNKSKNIRPKFEIHVVMYQGNLTPRVIERVKYTGDFHKAEENLRDFMFAKRQHVVRVKSFSIKQACSVRLPCDLKMRVEGLSLYGNVSPFLKLVKPTIDDSSFPLKSLTIYITSDDARNLDYEFIGSSELLTCGTYGVEFFPLILSFRNQKVHILSYSTDFLQSNNFIVLIRNWIENKKPIGTCFTFTLYRLEEKIAVRILDRVKDRFVDATAGNKCVKISMSVSAVLKISYFRNASSRLFIRMAVHPVR